jgi:hypothetical protein
MRLWNWFRDLPLGVKIFFVLSTAVLFFTLVPSPFAE